MLKSRDGVYFREWTSVDPRAVIILVHGLGGYSGRFFELGAYLGKCGFHVYAIELQGFGEFPIKGHIDSFKIYANDLKKLVGIANKDHRGKKVFIFGESMGGLITLDFSIHCRKMIDGIIVMSPGLSDTFIPIKTKMAIFTSLLLKPMTYFKAPFNAAIFTRDKVMGKRIENDPLEVRSFTAKFYYALLKSVLFVNLMAWRIKLPVLMMLAGKDKMVSAELNKKYFNKIRSKDKELKWYPEMYHALYIDEDREIVFKDIVDWLNRQVQ